MPIAQLFANLYNHTSSKSLEFGEIDRFFLNNIPKTFILNFDETGMQLKQILDARYVDGISGLESVEVEGNTITGVFTDIVSPSLTKKFNFTINADSGDVDYQQIDTGDLEQEFSEPEFAGKSATCKEGKSSPCKRADGSVYCIAVGKKCKSEGLSGEEKAVVVEVVEKAKKTSSRNRGTAEKSTKKKDLKNDIPTPTPDIKQQVEQVINEKPAKQVVTPKTAEQEQTISPKKQSKVSSPEELAKIPTVDEIDKNKKAYVVGAGSYGQVYLDKSTRPPRAVKYGKISDDEVELSKKMSDLGLSPKIYSDAVKTQDSSGSPTKAYAMEFIEGESFYKKYRGKNLDKKYPTQALKQVLEMRQKMHENGIYHGDMHDGNILVKKDGTATIIDLGLAGNGSDKDKKGKSKYALVYKDLTDKAFYDMIVKNSEDSELKSRLEKAQETLSKRASKLKSEEDYKKAISDFYKEMLSD